MLHSRRLDNRPRGRNLSARHLYTRSRGRFCDVDQPLPMHPRGPFESIHSRYTCAMLEVMIEQWKNLDGSIDYPWSVWRNGVRIHMGGVLDRAEDAETDAKAYCVARLGSEPDSVVRL